MSLFFGVEARVLGKQVLGEFEHHVLLAALRLGREGYTASIVQELEQVTGRSVAPAAVYIALRRLEEGGLADSMMRAPDSGAPARPRRYFKPTPLGTQMLDESRSRFQALWRGVDRWLPREG